MTQAIYSENAQTRIRNASPKLESQFCHIISGLRDLAKRAEDDNLFPYELARHDVVVVAQRILPKILQHGSSKDIEQFQVHFTAAKLGLRVKTVQDNRGFLEFAIQNKLDKYLCCFQHRLEKKNGEILLLKENSDVPISWTKVRNNNTLVSSELKLVGGYGYRGLKEVNFRNWRQLPVFKQVDASGWRHQFVVEVCVRCSIPPNGLGDHSWMRLRDSAGAIYSIGFSSDKDETVNYRTVGNIRNGYLISPDYAEFSDVPITSRQFPITSNEFEAIKSRIELDHVSNSLVFHVLQSNCTTYISNIINNNTKHRILTRKYFYPYFVLLIALRQLGTKFSWFNPELAYRVCQRIVETWGLGIDAITRCVPTTIVRMISSGMSKFVALPMNGAGLFLGSGKVQNGCQCSPFISTWNDLFDLKKSEIYHPSGLKQYLEEFK